LTDREARESVEATPGAVYVADKDLMVLVEHDLGLASAVYSERTKDGGFQAYSLAQGRVRVVQLCERCGSWDQKGLLSESKALGEAQDLHNCIVNPILSTWEHKDGQGCKKVGHGG